MKRLLVSVCIAFCCLSSLVTSAAESTNTVESATRRGLVMVTRAASNWQQHKTCFSCHHQTLPMLTAVTAERMGFPLDVAWLKSQAQTTHKYFADRTQDLDEGNHVPSGSSTAGYGLWALSLADRPADQTTTAIVTYLLKIQGVARLQGGASSDLSRVPNGRWTTSCRRLPLQGSDVADTALALIGMERYASTAQRPQLVKARAAAERWLAQAPLTTQEDHIWRLWGLYQLKGEGAAEASVRQGIMSTQLKDGGWAPIDGQPSDAFATGQTLFVLREEPRTRAGGKRQAMVGHPRPAEPRPGQSRRECPR